MREEGEGRRVQAHFRSSELDPVGSVLLVDASSDLQAVCGKRKQRDEAVSFAREGQRKGRMEKQEGGLKEVSSSSNSLSQAYRASSAASSLLGPSLMT